MMLSSELRRNSRLRSTRYSCRNVNRDHSVDIVLAEHFADGVVVADVGLDEGVVRSIFDVSQVGTELMDQDTVVKEQL